jgi:hypothetical protein
LWTLTQSRLWQHRKVESLRLLDGPQSIRRVSIDLTVPNDTRLVVRPDIPGALDEVFVPLAMVQKAHLQSFDARVDGSRPMPVATTSLDGLAMTAAIEHSWKLDIARDLNSIEIEAISRVVHAEGEAAWGSTQAFLDTGTIEDLQVEVGRLGGLTVHLLEIASSNFLLAGLLPSSQLGAHTVLKYQSHWELVSVRDDERPNWWSRYKSALGWDSAPLEIELNDVGLVPESLHLEVQTPAALFSERLEIVQGGVVIGEDLRPTTVSHVVTRPDDDLMLPDTALVYLRASPFGLLPWATISAVFTATFLWGGYLTPVLARLFDPEARVGGPVFLSAIALLLGIVTRTSENPLSGKVLGPLRLTVASLALVYFLLAVAIVVAVPLIVAKVVWFLGAILAGFFTFMLVVGYIQCRRSAVNKG